MNAHLSRSVDAPPESYYKVQMRKPLSFRYRLVHATLAVFGALTFIVGSAQYYPTKSRPFRGGALFTIGAVCYFCDDIADFMGMNKINYLTCWMGNTFLPHSQEPPSFVEWFRYHMLGLNSLLTTTGSVFYLLGCILFIPQLNSEGPGDIIFIPGSCIIMISEGWKLHRAGCVYKQEDGYMYIGRSFRWIHVWKGELVFFMGDLATWLGAALFLVGSIVFLPQYDTNTHDADVAASIFLIGSILYLFCALCLCWKYFCSGYHDEAPGMWESMCWKGLHTAELEKKVVALTPVTTHTDTLDGDEDNNVAGDNEV